MSDLGWHMFRIKSVCVHEHYGHAQSVPVLGSGKSGHPRLTLTAGLELQQANTNNRP